MLMLMGNKNDLSTERTVTREDGQQVQPVAPSPSPPPPPHTHMLYTCACFVLFDKAENINCCVRVVFNQFVKYMYVYNYQVMWFEYVKNTDLRF